MTKQLAKILTAHSLTEINVFFNLIIIKKILCNHRKSIGELFLLLLSHLVNFSRFENLTFFKPKLKIPII